MSVTNERSKLHQQDDSIPGLVVAIDFGTYASGFAWQFKSTYDSSTNKASEIKVPTNISSSNGIRSRKNPTCVLLSPNKEFDSFGYGAQEKYLELQEDKDEDESQWYYFERFKMELYKDQTMLTADNKKSLPAVEVFSVCIKHMKEKFVETLTKPRYEFLKGSVHWVLTVPAIWSQKARRLMRDAAEKAGIEGKHLTIALEPEAAAIYCRNIPADEISIQEQDCIIRLTKAGTRPMVVDMGGGTVDISVFTVKDDGDLQLIHKADGGPWGGIKVNDRFKGLVQSIFGEEVWTDFLANYKREAYEFLLDFESQKRSISSKEEDQNSTVRIRLPAKLKKVYERKTGKKLKDGLKSNDAVSLSYGGLQFRMDKMVELFDEITKMIVRKIDLIYEKLNSDDQPPTCVIPVGGCAESNVVLNALETNLTNKLPVVRPDETELAVMRGAVLYGQNNKVIDQRILPLTYGVAKSVPWSHLEDWNITPEQKKEHSEKGKEDWAEGVFEIHAKIGEKVHFDQWTEGIDYYPIEKYKNDQEVSVLIFSSHEVSPKFVSDCGCKCLGVLKVKYPKDKKNKTITVKMCFSDTELKVRAVDKETLETFETYLDLF